MLRTEVIHVNGNFQTQFKTKTWLSFWLQWTLHYEVSQPRLWCILNNICSYSFIQIPSLNIQLRVKIGSSKALHNRRLKIFTKYLNKWVRSNQSGWQSRYYIPRKLHRVSSKFQDAASLRTNLGWWFRRPSTFLVWQNRCVSILEQSRPWFTWFWFPHAAKQKNSIQWRSNQRMRFPKLLLKYAKSNAREVWKVTLIV